MSNLPKVHKTEGSKVPVKSWTHEIEDSARAQLDNIAKMPFIHKHIAVMPDVHWGLGATIGSVIPTYNAVIPAAVGVDIGCGMMAIKTSLTASDLPDNLHDLRTTIESQIPHGRSNNGRAGDIGSRQTADKLIMDVWAKLAARYYKITEKHPKALAFNNWNQLGTLGGGNHFIEVCLDEDQQVWIMLHSGSRGAGNKIGMYFIDKAKEEMERYHVLDSLPDKDLSYLVEHTELYDDYIEAVEWAQEYAKENRKLMMSIIIKIMVKEFKNFSITEKAINCHHNYIAKENHYGENVIITRKGAIRARKGDLGIIPGSMGDKSYIVRGLGNIESFCSCSHGAGRVMSRAKAKKLFTAQDLADQTKGIECPKDITRVDEIPAAYKPIEVVMENQKDLVEVVATLQQVLNIKG